MANLLSIAELAYRSVFPEPRTKTRVTLEEFIATAKTEYAVAMWIYRQEMIAQEGSFDMPTDLIEEKEMPVVDNKIDISGLKYLNGLPGDMWLQQVGELSCTCKYVKSTQNLAVLLCDDDSLGDIRRYIIRGRSIVFLDGTHANKLPIIYANTGSNIDADRIEVNDYVASKVRLKLLQLYSPQTKVDTTNNQNPND